LKFSGRYKGLGGIEIQQIKKAEGKSLRFNQTNIISEG